VSMYEKSKNSDYEQSNGSHQTHPIDFQFPDPKSVYNKQS
jgi:hypothetical protein